MTNIRVVIFGGNGFVGTAVAKVLVEAGATVRCVSRTPGVPVHLLTPLWAQQVEWIAGDAAKPDIDLLRDADVAIAAVGTAPTPTFTEQSYEEKVASNSLPNLGAIAAAKAAGVRRLVVLGAHLPAILNRDSFAYAKGKRLCLEAAEDFANTSEQHTAVVLQPSAIYGTRFNKHGEPSRLNWVLRLTATLRNMLPELLDPILPKRLVSIEAVAAMVMRASIDERFDGNITIVSNRDIIKGGTERS
ncbi:MAG: NAD(P)-dependent oxidoreductase [Gammaproteobacteria bacterium]|nr:NAD(P)-dependent oxidoreductase [Gammaproteobacteria bacterium]